MSAGDDSSKSNITVAKLVLAGAIITVVGAVVVALINTASAAQSDPTPTPTPTSSSTSPPTTSTPVPTEDRRHFQVPVGEFTLDGDMVWRGESSVASSGELDLGDADDSAKCRVRIEFTPMGINDMPVGKDEVRGCLKGEVVKVWPEFGPVEFQNDRQIAYVAGAVYFDDKPVVKIHCPRKADCVVS